MFFLFFFTLIHTFICALLTIDKWMEIITVTRIIMSHDKLVWLSTLQALPICFGCLPLPVKTLPNHSATLSAHFTH